MARKSSLRNLSATLAVVVFGLLLGAAWAQSESVLYSFCAQNNCTDGQYPSTGQLVFDEKGNLYGTTFSGGIQHNGCFYGCGVVFKVSPEGQETVLHSFCAQENCADGAGPLAGMVFDQKGNLYGTTHWGGASNSGSGVVFKLTPEGKETVLYSFCLQINCVDGAEPLGGLIFDEKGNLYGTTYRGGASDGGVVFKLTPEGKESVLHSFCTQGGYSCTDGGFPWAGLVLDDAGNLYGTTTFGGAYDKGVVFKIAPKGKETVLYSFCSQGGSNCIDGNDSQAGLVFDLKGNLYGTAEEGGAYGGGVVFKLTPEGKYVVLHSFCAETNCADGSTPAAGLVFDKRGNLYGTTGGGGEPRGGGVAFKLTPEGKETVLYSFCWQDNCADGASPSSGLVSDREGDLYGTTYFGGADEKCGGQDPGCGAVFKLKP